jgi:S2P endopeptidase
VTIPISHAPTLLLAFFVNQLLHELGHAISGAMFAFFSLQRPTLADPYCRDDVQMSRFSFNFHLLFPSASVTFPSSVDSIST